VQISHDPEAAENFGFQGFRHCRHFMVRDSVYLRPLSEATDDDQEVVTIPVALRQMSRDAYVDHVVQCPDDVLVHQAPTPGSCTTA
jgi:hypothetical protein